jgi:hypothetical protein
MKTVLLRCFCVLAFSLFASPAGATDNLNQGFNAFAAVGVALTPGSFRLGYNAWETGMISPGFFGAIKSFPWGKSTYSSFGFGMNSDGFKSMPGFQAAAGFDFDLFWNIGLRGEFMARTNLNGTAVSFGLLGLSYGF